MNKIHISQKERTCFVCHAPINVGQPYKGSGKRSKHPNCIGAGSRVWQARKARADQDLTA